MLPDLANSYDWNEAFVYASKPDSIITSQTNTTGYKIEDVEAIIAMVEGENDGSEWVGVFKLKDGRYASLIAGCDYSGWD